MRVTTNQKIFLLFKKPLDADDYLTVCKTIDHALAQYHFVVQTPNFEAPYSSDAAHIEHFLPELVKALRLKSRKSQEHQYNFARELYAVPVYLCQLFQFMIKDPHRPRRLKTFTVEDLNQCWSFFKDKAPKSRPDVIIALGVVAGLSGIRLEEQELGIDPELRDELWRVVLKG